MMDRKEIQEAVDSIKFWYHSIPLGQEVVTPGMVPLEEEESKARGIPDDLTGMSVLDIGSADGYYSFLAEQRGASRVLAIDSFPFKMGGKQGGTEQYRYQSSKGFYLAKEILHSNVEFREMDIYELDELEEPFDVVFLFEVHHHVWDPILGIDLACKKCNKGILIEGNVLGTDIPILCYEPKRGDETKNWRLATGLVWRLLEDRGFKKLVRVYSVTESVFFLGFVPQLPPDVPLTLQSNRELIRAWR